MGYTVGCKQKTPVDNEVTSLRFLWGDIVDEDEAWINYHVVERSNMIHSPK